MTPSTTRLTKPRRKKARPTPILTDQDIRIVKEIVQGSLASALIGQRLAMGASLDDTLRYSSVSLHLTAARKARGLDIKQAAAALKVPQYRLLAIEGGRLPEIDASVFRRYVAFLDEARWFGRWKKAHPALAARLTGETPPDPDPWVGRMPEPEGRGSSAVVPRGVRALREARRSYRNVCALRVELREIQPAVWRRLVVPEAISLHELHHVIQVAMGWTDTHLYDFNTRGATFSEPDEEDEDLGRFVHDSRIVLLGDLRLGRGSTFRYLYDFGDSWDHTITVEAAKPPDADRPVPACLDGRRACPPEDVGGAGGYERMLKALADPDDEEREEFLRWIGPGFDPESFDAKTVNVLLKQEQALWRRRLGGEDP